MMIVYLRSTNQSNTLVAASRERRKAGVDVPYICTRMWMWFSEGWGTLWDDLVSGE